MTTITTTRTDVEKLLPLKLPLGITITHLTGNASGTVQLPAVDGNPGATLPMSITIQDA